MTQNLKFVNAESVTTPGTKFELESSLSSLAPASAKIDKSSTTRFHRKQRNLTFISLFVGYAAYYFCRQNLSVAYGPMKESLGIDAVQFGWISSVGTLVYALGKVSLGAIADSKKYGGRIVFLIGIFGSAIFSIFFGLGSGLFFFIVMWSFTRLLQSLGWGGLVSVVGRWFPPESYGQAMSWLGVSYQCGAVIGSLFAGMLLALGLSWQMIFIIPALTQITIGLMIRPFLTHPHQSSVTSEAAPPSISTSRSTPSGVSCESNLTYRERFKSLFANRGFTNMLGLAFILTFLRECFNLWMPAYFAELGSSPSESAFKSVVFQILGCGGALFSGWFSDRFLQGRRAPLMAAMMFILVSLLCALGNLERLAASTGLTPNTGSLILVSLIGFFMLGPYSLVSGVVALDFGGKKTAGTAAGILDGSGYLGAVLSGVGVAQVVAHAGWNISFLIMAALTGCGVLLCGRIWNLRPKDA